jgi:probable HAF family extracellular repeat protein
MTDLGALPGSSYSVASAINSRGLIAGASGYGARSEHAVIWRDGAITDLGTLPGDTQSHATAVNGKGDVVGCSINDRAEMRAFLYSHGRMRDLGSLGGAPTRPEAIDDRGRIVGSSADPDGVRHAFLWQNGTMADLNALIPPHSGWTLEEAYAIDRRGSIVCTGMRSDMYRHLILLVPAKRDR